MLTHRFSRMTALSVLAAALASSCAPSENDAPEPCPETSTDLRRQILIPRCGECHGVEDPAAGLNLVQAGIEQRVVDVYSEDCDFKLVAPGRPDASLLLLKLGPEPPCGDSMPKKGSSLPAHEVSCVRAWIEGLAPAASDASGDGSAVDASAPDATGDAPADAPAHPSCPAGQMSCGGRCINAIEPRFGSLHSRIFARSCSFESCHSGDRPKEGLDLLDPELFHPHAVDVPSLQRPELMRVKPNLPEQSYLVHKLRGVNLAEHDSTGLQESVRMPPEQPLCEEKIVLVEQWIAAGAPKD